MTIAAESLRAGYGSRTVLFDVDAVVRTGEILGIFGHNGAGKTTLLRVLAGSLTPRSGSVRAAGGEVPVIRLVPQEEMVFEHLSVRENLMIGLWNDKAAWRTADKRIASVCELLPTVGRILGRRGGALSAAASAARSRWPARCYPSRTYCWSMSHRWACHRSRSTS